MTQEIEPTQQFENLELRAATQNAENLFNLLNENPLGRVPESIFKKHFLALFSGEAKGEASESLYAYWIQVARGPLGRVDVFDDRTGDVLFRVPPMLDSSVIDPSKKINGPSYSQVIAISKMYSEQTKFIGEAKLQEGLAEKYFKLIEKSANFSEDTKTWVSILARYGKLEDIQKAAGIDTKSSDGKVTDDDFEY